MPDKKQDPKDLNELKADLVRRDIALREKQIAHAKLSWWRKPAYIGSVVPGILTLAGLIWAVTNGIIQHRRGEIDVLNQKQEVLKREIVLEESKLMVAKRETEASIKELTGRQEEIKGLKAKVIVMGDSVKVLTKEKTAVEETLRGSEKKVEEVEAGLILSTATNEALSTKNVELTQLVEANEATLAQLVTELEELTLKEPRLFRVSNDEIVGISLQNRPGSVHLRVVVDVKDDLVTLLGHEEWASETDSPIQLYDDVIRQWTDRRIIFDPAALRRAMNEAKDNYVPPTIIPENMHHRVPATFRIAGYEFRVTTVDQKRSGWLLLQP